MTHGGRSGCNFTGKSLPDFTDINFCVNGSSPEGPLRPSFTTLQTQNHGAYANPALNTSVIELVLLCSACQNLLFCAFLVKPAATEELHLQTGPDRQMDLRWEDPAGDVPGHCLEYEVEHSQEGADAEEILV